MRSGTNPIVFAAELSDEKDPRKLEVSFKIEQLKGRNDFYVLNGYNATLKQEGKQDVSQCMTIFEKRGFTVDETMELLSGGAVRNRAKAGDGEISDRRTIIDFESKTPSGNYRMRHYPASDLNLVALLSQVNGQFRRNEKDEILKSLDKGKAVPITLTSGDSAILRLAPQDKALRLIHPDGSMTPATENTTRSVQMKPLPESTLKLIGQGKDQSKNNKSRGQRA